MKALAINGSSRKNGNTSLILEHILGVLKQTGIKTDMIQLASLEICPCQACFACRNKMSCPAIEDDFNSILEAMKSSDCIILGSPVYSSDVSAKMKALIDRAAVVAAVNPGLFRHKIGAAVAAVRRAGGMTAIDTMNHFFLNKEMVIAGSTYWNMVFGNAIGEALNDAEGMRNMQNLAENLIFIMNRIHS